MPQINEVSKTDVELAEEKETLENEYIHQPLRRMRETSQS